MSRLPHHTVDDAPSVSRDLLSEMAAVSPTGRPLNLHAELAAAPAVLHAYVALRRAPEQHGGLEPRIRIGLMLTAAAAIGNAYTVAIVSMLARRVGWDEADVDAIRAGADVGDERFDTLARVVRKAGVGAGRVDDATWRAALDAGWEPRELAEAFSPLALVLFTACFANYADTELDAALTAAMARS
jgi:hypothetical protein